MAMNPFIRRLILSHALMHAKEHKALTLNRILEIDWCGRVRYGVTTMQLSSQHLKELRHALAQCNNPP